MSSIVGKCYRIKQSFEPIGTPNAQTWYLYRRVTKASANGYICLEFETRPGNHIQVCPAHWRMAEVVRERAEEISEKEFLDQIQVVWSKITMELPV